VNGSLAPQQVFRVPLVLLVPRIVFLPIEFAAALWFIHMFLVGYTGQLMQGVAIAAMLWALCGVGLAAWGYWNAPHRLEVSDGLLTATFLSGRSSTWPVGKVWRQTTMLTRLIMSDEVVDEAGERLFILSRLFRNWSDLTVVIRERPRRAA